jgi:glycosyltransferase involved in cell wall biosynthesis
MRILILQHGDYADAYRRFENGGPETFRDQRHSVSYVSSLTPEHEVTTVAICNRAHDEEPAPRLRSIGVPSDLAWDRDRLWPLFDRIDPEAFVCRTPNRVALAWAVRTQIPTLPILADTFTNKGLRNRLNNWRLRRVLMRCRATCVANHSLSASQSLRYIGLSPDRIVRWEHRRMEPVGEAKAPPPPDRPFRLFFVGALIESKGVGDCIDAVAIARDHDQVELTIAGAGAPDQWTALARQRRVEPYIRLLGIIPVERVLKEMREHDVVIVPSRHDYAEGLPNTVYEALASRSPLIGSDHPGFVQRLRPDVDSLRFKAGDPRDLARQIQRLIHEPGLHARLSRESAVALASLYGGIEWSELVSKFIEDPLCASDWTKGHTLGDRSNR